MRSFSLLFLFILAWTSYCDAAIDRDDKEIVSTDDLAPADQVMREKRASPVPGGETVENPNDPKYQEMAKQLVHDYIGIKGNVKIEVLNVTEQVVEGTITRLTLRIYNIISKRSHPTCKFEVWEELRKNLKHVTYACDTFKDKKISLSTTAHRPQQVRDPKNPKYQKLAMSSIHSLFKTPGSKPFKKEDVKTVSVINVLAQIGSHILNHIRFNVITSDGSSFKCQTQVFETPWNSTEPVKVTSVSCSSNQGPILPNHKLQSMPSPQIAGGEEDQNPADPQYTQLANKAFKKYEDAQKMSYDVDKLQVTKVTTQVVSGVITRIDYDVFLHNHFGGHLHCHSEIWEQPWIPNETMDAKCEMVGDFNKKLSLSKKKPLGLGKEEVQNPDDPKYKKLAKDSFEKYKETEHLKYTAKYITVTRVTTQVVEGLLTRLDYNVFIKGYDGGHLKCHSEVWERPWIGEKKTDTKCQMVGDDYKTKLSLSKNKSLGAGEEEVQNPDDPKYKQLAKEAFEKYKQEHGIKYIVDDIKVTKVTTQVVSGKLTRLDYKVFLHRYTGGHYECHSEVWEQPWIHKKTIKTKCQMVGDSYQRLSLSKNKPHKIGGEKIQNPDDPKYKKLAKEAFEKYKKEHGIKYIVEDIKVTKVTTQLVAGTLTRLDYKVFLRRYAGGHYECHSEVWEQPWIHKKTIKTKCQMVGDSYQRLSLSKNKPHKIGGQEIQNPDDPKYKKQAKEAFEKYKKEHGIKYIVEDIKVTKVTTQLVAGTLTRLDYKVFLRRYTGGHYECHSEVWEQPWIHKKTIKTKCHMVADGFKKK